MSFFQLDLRDPGLPGFAGLLGLPGLLGCQQRDFCLLSQEKTSLPTILQLELEVLNQPNLNTRGQADILKFNRPLGYPL